MSARIARARKVTVLLHKIGNKMRLLAYSKYSFDGFLPMGVHWHVHVEEDCNILDCDRQESVEEDCNILDCDRQESVEEDCNILE